MRHSNLINSLEFLFDYHSNRNNVESINIVKTTRGMIRLLKSGINPLANFDLPLANKINLSIIDKFQLTADVEKVIISVLNSYINNFTSTDFSFSKKSTRDELEVRINGEFKGFFKSCEFITFIKGSSFLKSNNKSKIDIFLQTILENVTKRKGTCEFYNVEPCCMTSSEISVRHRYMC